MVDRLDAAKSALRGVRSDSPVWQIVPQLIAQPIVTTAYLCDSLGLSKPQAERAVKRLEEAGVLTRRGEARRNVIWEHRGILDVLDEYAAGLRRG